MRSTASRPSFVVTALVAACACLLLAACPAVYPELKTPMRPVVPGHALEPPPPPELRWIAFKSAKVPALTRDGRRWGSDLGGRMPDPYAKLIVNGAELLRSTVEKATLAPTWPDAPKGNFRIRADDRMRVELWDARVINDHPIGVREVGALTSEQRSLDEIDIECESGARIRLANEPAHGFVGYGLFYELRTYDAVVTRVYEESPASRGGLRPGDLILAIEGRSPRQMQPGELQSLLNAPTVNGIAVAVQHEDGSRASVRLKEGAVYPLFREFGAFE
jgi:hypothetical protein